MLEATEASFDLVALLVEGFIVGMKILRLRFDGITASAFMSAISPRKSLLS